MNKKNKIILIVVVAVISIVSFFGGYVARYYFVDDDIRAIHDLVEKYKKYYYYDDGDLVKEIADVILDEYSTYYTAEEYEEILNGAKGNYKGVGLGFVNNTLQIGMVLGNSPCEKVGVKKGGKVVYLNVGSGDLPVNNVSEFTAVLDAVAFDKDFIIKIDYDGVIEEYTIAKKEYKRTYVHRHCQSNDKNKQNRLFHSFCSLFLYRTATDKARISDYPPYRRQPKRNF